MKKLGIIFSLILTMFVKPCLAELHECAGTWTNKPCEELNKKQERTSIKDPERGKKESILHDLRMSVIKAKRDYDIRYNLTVTEDKCKKSSLEVCDRSVKEAQKDLQTLISNVQKVKTEEQRNELIKEANKIHKERNEIEANKPTVIIQQNTIITPRRRPNWPHHKSKDSIKIKDQENKQQSIQ